MKPSHLVATFMRAMACACICAALSIIQVNNAYAADEATGQASTPSLTTQATSYDIGNGSVTCNQGGTLYTITGTSNKHTITVKGGTAENPVMVDLAGVTMKFQGEKDGDSTEAAPLTIEDDAYAIIYIGKDSSSVVDTLTGGNNHGVGKNTGYAGICVKSKAHVTIAGQGTLNVTGGGVEYGAAAVGGNYDDDVHDLTINGSVTINATGGYSAPGIGSGRDGELYGLVINSGTINATGGKYAPGIGAGDAVGTGGGGGSGGDVSSITIFAGTITATGGANGAGIGGGKGADSGTIGLYQDEGKTFALTATGGTNGAGIGSAGHDSNQIFVNLKGGTITATGGDSGAGIGAGNADAGSISIEGAGTVSAKGGKQGCGIGAGEDSTAEEIRIYGYGDSSLTINAEALTVVPTDETALKMGPAFYANKSAAIGSGRSECGPIKIQYALINAAANGYGADIGGGNNHGWNPASVKSIYIEGCTVKSQDFGGNVPNDKVAPSIGAGADGNMGTIEIWSSTITGAGIGAASDNFDDCNAVDSVKIITSTVTAIRQVVDWDASTSASQAAGIGSGIKGDVGSIDIEDSTVTAQGVGGGAGIGSGGVSGARYLEGADPGTSDVGTITIERSNITATGSVQKVKDGLESGGAGIGLGFAVKGSGTIHSILIEQCNSVVGTGEWGAAGIGTSCGSNFTGGDDGDGNVTITDSGVTAKGGYGAAGIGAGMQYGAHGGDARIIKIMGSSAITATGGEGAAGIGGGKDGGVDAATIALESTGIPPASIQYVTAAGGLGAAGIGSGAGGHDVGSVTIQSGYVTATGGTDLDGKGTGAGIGGGNAKGALRNLSISGGFINASAGSSDAYDIGCGGTNGALSTDQNGTFTISGGTVLATNIGYAKTMTVTGGSVLANLANAYDAAHNHVYRTTLTLPIGSKTEAGISSFVDGYGTTDIYSDGNRKVYLYRTATDAFKASADVTMMPPYQATYHYIGQTLADGTGLLKMQPQISFKDPETAPTVGDTFKLYVDDSELPSPSRWGNCVYTVSGCASYVENQSDGRHTGAYVSLAANGMGAYTVTATCAAPPESADVYWPATASYTGTVTKQAGAITITEDSSKVYDGKQVVDPSVKKTGDGEVAYTYYQTTSEGETQLKGTPSDAGSYRVEATMAETAHYTAASASATFTIGQRPVVLGLSAALSGDTATLTTTVTNMIDAAGQVDFTVTPQGGSSVTVRADIVQSGDAYIAQTTFPNVGAGTYAVEASYAAGWPANYSCASSATATFDKAKATRSIICDDPFSKKLGDADFYLSPTASKSTPGDADTFTYQIVDDPLAALDNQSTLSVGLNNGYVSIVHAGTVTIKITLTDANGNYNEAVKYVTVKAARALLTVTPYVEDSSGKQITEATYGSLDSLTYGLTFVGLRPGDTGDTFAGGHGKLEAIPLAPTAGAGDYTIGIKRVGNGSVTINGNTYNNVFVSRDYEISEVERVFEVKPATLTATARNATGMWHGTEPTYSATVSGFVLGDTASTVFSTPPAASLDQAKTVGLPYSLLDPGTYASAIAPDSGTQIRNGEGYYNYDVTTTPGTLTVSKLDTALAISVDSKTYDGSAVTPKVSTNPAFDGTYTVTYYPLDSETALPSAPTDAGQYRAVATVKDDKHFTDDTAACLFTISKAAPDVETPTIADLTYRAGLTLADVALPSGWTWDAPTTALSAGAVKANATYTPTDTANYTTVTRGLSFDVAQAAASITITGDPSKTYDGNAVTDPAVTKTSDGAVTYAYYTGADTTATPLASAPTGAGSYTVVATVAETADYKTASASRAFTIAKATPTPETPSLASLVYKDGLTLSDEALPAGWAWNEPTRAISVGTVSAYATYTPSDTANYTTVVQMLSFDVLEGQGTVSITEDVSQTFDGSAVGNPAVSKTGDGTVAYAYYAGTSASGTALASAPVDAGTYTVVATLAETKSYKGASDSATFAIAKRPVVLGISASQNGTSATVTVTAAGLIAADGSAKIAVPDASGAIVTKEVPFAQTASGAFEATATFDSVASGTYKVTASYVAGASGNYACDAPATATYDKSKSTRTISLPKTSYDKNYGDPAFNLGASTDKKTAGDTFTYEVVQDSFSALGLPASVSVGAKGNVTVENAGTSTIKVTLSDTTKPGIYNDAVAYVKVSVKRVPLSATSYAQVNGATVTSAVYGSLDAVTYGVDLGGLVNGDTAGDFTNGHGTLSARSLDNQSDVAKSAYELPIDQVGSMGAASTTAGGLSTAAAGSMFASRNYAITYKTGTLAVTPAALTVRAADATGIWEGTEPAYAAAVDGLASWEGADSVFSTKPAVVLDTSKTGGKTYEQLEPGTYDGVLKVASIGTLKPNSNGLYNYTVTEAPAQTASATLTVEKVQGTISITSDPSKTYDGKAVSDPTVSKNGSGAVTYTYYAGTDTSTTPLASAPKDAGTYTVVAVMAADDHYTSASASRTFTIASPANGGGTGSNTDSGTSGSDATAGGSGTMANPVVVDGESAMPAAATANTGDESSIVVALLALIALAAGTCAAWCRRNKGWGTLPW